MKKGVLLPACCASSANYSIYAGEIHDAIVLHTVLDQTDEISP